MNAGAEVITFAVKNNISSLRSILLDGASRCANGLVAAEEDVGVWVTDCGFQVVDNAASTKHAGGSYDDTGPNLAFQIIDGVQSSEPNLFSNGHVFASAQTVRQADRGGVAS